MNHFHLILGTQSNFLLLICPPPSPCSTGAITLLIDFKFDGGRNVIEQAAAEEDIENSSTGMGRMKRMKKSPSWMKDNVI